MVQPCVSIQRLITRVIHAFIHVFQHVEEILGYLQVCVKLEATKTLLCVQQVFINMLHHIFSYMSGQGFSSWRFRPSKSLPSPDRPHHDEFAPSIITCSPAPFPVCPQIYNSFSHSRTCSLFEERNNDGLSKDPDNVKKRKPRTSHKRKELGEGGEVVIQVGLNLMYFIAQSHRFGSKLVMGELPMGRSLQIPCVA